MRAARPRAAPRADAGGVVPGRGVLERRGRSSTMTSHEEGQKESPLRERVFSWEEFKAGWRLVRSHSQDDKEEE
jgi:hypothetical protein